MPTPPRPGGVARGCDSVIIAHDVPVALCGGCAVAYPPYEKRKRRSTDRPYFSENSPNQDFFLLAAMQATFFQTTVNQLLLNNGYQVADDIVQHQT